MPSQTRTGASVHNGWGSGNGRDYDDNVCRSASNSGWYYAYQYIFTSLGSTAVMLGVQVRHHVGASGSWDFDLYDIQLTQGTSRQGTGKTNRGMAECTSCSDAGLSTQGANNDLWGLSAAAMKTLVNHSDFGAAFNNQNTNGNPVYEDGFEITIYYSDIGEAWRRASVTPGFADDVNRRAEVTVFNAGYTRRATQNTAVTLDNFRYAEVTSATTKESTRRSSLNTAVTGDFTRRSEVFAAVWWVYDDLTRRAVVWAEPQAQDKRRAEVFVIPYVGDTTRRSIITVAATREETRRVFVDVDADYFINDEVRRAVVISENAKSEVRRSEISVALIEDLTRRAVVLPSGTDVVRRALIDVDADYFINEDVRRSVVAVENAKSEVRRAEVFVVRIDEPVRRAIVLSAGTDIIRRALVDVDADYFIGDEIRRALVTVDVSNITRRAEVSVIILEDLTRRAQVIAAGTDIVRRALVDVDADYLINDENRRAEVNVLLPDYTRRAEVTVLKVFLYGEGIRRAIVTVEVSSVTRRAEVDVDHAGWIRRAKVSVYSRWFYGWPGRRAEVSTAVTSEPTRRAEVFRVLVGEPVRRSEVTIVVVADDARESNVTVFRITTADEKRKSKVIVSAPGRIRITTRIKEL